MSIYVQAGSLPIGARFTRPDMSGAVVYTVVRLAPNYRGSVLTQRSDGRPGGGPNHEFRIYCSEQVLPTDRKPGDPPRRYGPYKPVAKALP